MVSEKAVINNAEFSQAMNELVNGWFKRWRGKDIPDDDWNQCADELNEVYARHPFRLIRGIGAELILELERRQKHDD